MQTTSYLESFFGMLFGAETRDELRKNAKDGLNKPSVKSAIEGYNNKRGVTASPPRGLKELKNANTNT